MGAVLWGGYQALVTILSTEMNSLANGALTALGSVLNNSSGLVYADLEFASGGSFSPTGGMIQVWFLVSLDGGSTYEDGGGAVMPSGLPDASIPIRVGSSIVVRCGCPRIQLPVGYYKPVALNATGATLPTVNNIIRMATYTETL